MSAIDPADIVSVSASAARQNDPATTEFFRKLAALGIPVLSDNMLADDKIEIYRKGNNVTMITVGGAA